MCLKFPLDLLEANEWYGWSCQRTHPRSRGSWRSPWRKRSCPGSVWTQSHRQDETPRRRTHQRCNQQQRWPPTAQTWSTQHEAWVQHSGTEPRRYARSRQTSSWCRGSDGPTVERCPCRNCNREHRNTFTGVIHHHPFIILATKMIDAILLPSRDTLESTTTDSLGLLSQCPILKSSHCNSFHSSKVKCWNTLSCLDQYTCRGLRLWNSPDHEAVQGLALLTLS